MPFSFEALSIPGLILVKSRFFRDERGVFMETYKKSDFYAHGIESPFVQDNYSLSTRNVLRGLHYQVLPAAQAKLVRVLKGRIWDVAVDIRKNLPSFGQWIGVELSDKNHHLLFIPIGFAHGFVALSEEVHLVYKCSSEYSPAHERTILWNDPDLDIHWPVDTPLVSQKDIAGVNFKKAEFFPSSMGES